MSDVPTTFSILPSHIEERLSGDLLETHQLALRAIDALPILRSLIVHFNYDPNCSKGLLEQFVSAMVQVQEVCTQWGVYDTVATELTEASHEKTIEYEEHVGDCFHHFVFRIALANYNAVMWTFAPMDWRDRKQVEMWFESWVARYSPFSSEPFKFGIGWKEGWRLRGELRREALKAANILLSDSSRRSNNASQLSREDSNAAGKPKWNRDQGKLYYDERKIKFIRSISVAKNVVSVLDAFEEEGWPNRIDDPLSPSKDQQRLHETIRRLNDNLAVIRFRADGTGTGIVWEELATDNCKGTAQEPHRN